MTKHNKLSSRLTFASVLVTLLMLTSINQAAIIPAPLELVENLSSYPLQPNEILPIQPVLLYPKPRKLDYQGRTLDKDDNDIIYVQLLKRKSYRPKARPSSDNDIVNTTPRELTMKDIFYVKALTNGQFSHQRIKWYRLPEFYAISVYHKGDQM